MKAQLGSNTHRNRIKLETLLELESYCNSHLYEDHLGEGSIISICAEQLHYKYNNLYESLRKDDFLIKCQLLKQTMSSPIGKNDLKHYFIQLFQQNKKTTYEDAIRLVRNFDTFSSKLRQPLFKETFEEVAKEWRENV